MTDFVLLLLMLAVILGCYNALARRGSTSPQSDGYGEAVERGGLAVQCRHCGHAAFHARTAKLNTTGMTLLGLDWANRDATCFVCARCGFIHWFLD